MAVKEKNILNRLYFVAGCMFVFALLVAFKLVNIQLVQGDQYREFSRKKNHSKCRYSSK